MHNFLAITLINKKMNSIHLKKLHLLILFLGLSISYNLKAQVGGWQPELTEDSKKALDKMVETNSGIESYHKSAYGYVVFPKVTKAGLVLGGAGGKGIVYENHEVTGSSTLKQASVGLQAGGQQYSEIIFFENKKAYKHFVNGKLKFDAQVSAVAIKPGVSLDVAYVNGVTVFTQPIGGLMFEASVGGQHFTYKAK
jgi:lipid-binding SYLF domain-containing protein